MRPDFRDFAAATGALLSLVAIILLAIQEIPIPDALVAYSASSCTWLYIRTIIANH